MKNKPFYFESVHLLRGIAALIVVLGHTFGAIAPEALIFFLDGGVGVAIFFVISGFVLPLALGSKYRITYFPIFLMKRFVRIEPTFLVSCVIAAAILYLKTRLAPNGNPWTPELGQVAAHLFYVIPFTDYHWFNEVYWTLAIEFQFYVLIGLCFSLVRKYLYTFWPMVLIITLFSLLTLIGKIVPEIGLLKNAPFFAMGIAAYAYHINGRSLLELGGITLWLTLIGLTGDIEGKELAFAALGAILIIGWKPSKIRLRILGTISYSLYVVHYPIATLINQVACHLFAETQHGWLLFASLVAFIVSIIASMVLYHLVERPTHKLSRSIRLG